MEYNAKISVIVPVFGVEAFLHRCIDSILNQSWTCFDLILVDDGSLDKSGVICDEYARKDSRIHVIHQKNRGLSGARNAGLEWALAQSDSCWIAFVDSDDWIHKDYLKILYEEVERSGTKAAVCSRMRVKDFVPDQEIGNVVFRKMDMDHAYLENYCGCNPAYCKLLNKALLRDIRFPEGKLYEDIFILYQILLNAGMVSICCVPLYYYFYNPGSITKMVWTERHLDQIEAHEQRLAFLKAGGYLNAYKRCVEAYTIALVEQMRRLEITESRHTVYYAEMRRKYRKAFREAWELGRFPLNDENWSMYRQAGWPRLVLRMRMYLQVK